MIAIITDTHFTIKYDKANHVSYLNTCYADFWRFIDDNNVKEIIHSGDFFDKRKGLDYKEIDIARKLFIDEAVKRNVIIHLIPGNHDVYYKTTNDLSSIDFFLSYLDNFKLYFTPTIITIEKQKFALVPWTSEQVDNNNDIISFMETNKSVDTILVGHFDTVGVDMGHDLSTHGFDMSFFDGWQEVWTGHYHQKSVNIVGKTVLTYLGSFNQFNMNDAFIYGSDNDHSYRGFHTYSKKKLKYHSNSTFLYVKHIIKSESDYILEPFRDKVVVLYVVTTPVDEYRLNLYVEGLKSVAFGVKIVRSDYVSTRIDDSDPILTKDNKSLILDYIKTNYGDKNFDVDMLCSIISDTFDVVERDNNG